MTHTTGHLAKYTEPSVWTSNSVYNREFNGTLKVTIDTFDLLNCSSAWYYSPTMIPHAMNHVEHTNILYVYSDGVMHFMLFLNIFVSQ